MKVSSQSDCYRGCQSGVVMDDDVYAEGWEPDVIYPPCACHPAYCVTCSGSGWCPENIENDSDDCPACGGSGWLGEPEHPPRAEAEPNGGTDAST